MYIGFVWTQGQVPLELELLVVICYPMRMLRIELGSLARVGWKRIFLVSCKEAQEQSQNNELRRKTLSQNNKNDDDDDENSLMYHFLLCLIVISLKCPISTINTDSKRLH